MQPEVRPIPSAIFLGPRKIGQTVDSVVTLQIPEGEKWKVERIEIDSEDVTIRKNDSEGSSTAVPYLIRQRIVKEGPNSTTIRFVIEKKPNDSLILPLTVSYEGETKGILSEAQERKEKP
jgi:hypothetical protein